MKNKISLGNFIDKKDILCISLKNSRLQYAISKPNINEINDIIFVNLTDKINLKFFIKRHFENFASIIFLKEPNAYKIKKNKSLVLQFLRKNLNFVRFKDEFIILKKESSISEEKINFKFNDFEIQIDKKDIKFFPLKTLQSIKKFLKLLKIKKLNFNKLNIFITDEINYLNYEVNLTENMKNYNLLVYKSDSIEIEKISDNIYKVNNEFKNSDLEITDLKKLKLLMNPELFNLFNNIILFNNKLTNKKFIALNFNKDLPHLTVEFDTFQKDKKLILDTISFLCKSKFLNLIYYFSNEKIREDTSENLYLNLKKLNIILKKFKKTLYKIENTIKILEI